MIIKITKSVVLPAALVSVVVGSSVQISHAGVFNNLVEVANGALATYGRETTRAGRQDLSTTEITAALRQVLKLGADNVMARLNLRGFSEDAVRIELPRTWRKARKFSAKIGYGDEFDELEEKLNIAAASTAPATRRLINQYVDQMAFDNPREILNSHDIAATHFLREKINDKLVVRLKPVVDQLLTEAGASDTSGRIERHLGHFGLGKNLQADLADHVVAKSLDGFFHYLAREEQSMRINPDRRSTELLQKVFG